MAVIKPDASGAEPRGLAEAFQRGAALQLIDDPLAQLVRGFDLNHVLPQHTVKILFVLQLGLGQGIGVDDGFKLTPLLLIHLSVQIPVQILIKFHLIHRVV